MTLLNSINYNGVSNYQKPAISASTKRKLESLGIDPNLVTSETQALSLIATRQSEKSFEQYAVSSDTSKTEQKNNSSESSLISDSKLLAEQLGITINSDDTFEDITNRISEAIQKLINDSNGNQQVLERAEEYKRQLANLTGQYNNISNTNSNLYSAMSLQAYNTRYMLGI